MQIENAENCEQSEINMLTPEEIKSIELLVQSQTDLGFVSFAKEYYTGKLKLNEANYIKVNLPDSAEKFKTGNGEGIWACPVTEADMKIYDADIKGTEFDVYVLNDCLYYPIACASIIRVVCSGGSRPVLSYNWMDNVIKTTSKGSRSILDIIES